MKRILYWTLSVILSQAVAIAVVALFLHAPAKARHRPVDPFRTAVVYDQLGLFVVNQDRTSGTRFLTAELTLVLDAPRTIAAVDAQKSELRDVVIRILRSESIKGLLSAGEMDRLEQRIADALNPVLKNGQILEVCYNRLFQQ